MISTEKETFRLFVCLTFSLLQIDGHKLSRRKKPTVTFRVS